MSASTGQGATAVQAPHLFAGTTSGPRNLLHHDTMSEYGFTASSTATAHRHHNDDCANARIERKASNREHLRAFSFYFRTSRYYNPTPPFAYYKRGGRDPQQRERRRKTTPSNGNVLSTHPKHSNAPTHRDLGAIPLSTSLYLPTTSTPAQGNTSSSEHWT
jgi:hypothetical protein